MRGGQKQAVREWGVIVVLIVVLILASGSAGALLVKVGQGLGWLG